MLIHELRAVITSLDISPCLGLGVPGYIYLNTPDYKQQNAPRLHTVSERLDKIIPQK